MGEGSKEGFCVFAGVVRDEITGLGDGNDGHWFHDLEPLQGRKSEDGKLQGLMGASL